MPYGLDDYTVGGDDTGLSKVITSKNKGMDNITSFSINMITKVISEINTFLLTRSLISDALQKGIFPELCQQR